MLEAELSVVAGQYQSIPTTSLSLLLKHGSLKQATGPSSQQHCELPPRVSTLTSPLAHPNFQGMELIKISSGPILDLVCTYNSVGTIHSLAAQPHSFSSVDPISCLAPSPPPPSLNSCRQRTRRNTAEREGDSEEHHRLRSHQLAGRSWEEPPGRTKKEGMTEGGLLERTSSMHNTQLHFTGNSQGSKPLCTSGCIALYIEAKKAVWFSGYCPLHW